jgi:hypothetical protein
VDRRQGRSLGARVLGLWWQDVEYGHRAPFSSAVGAACLEELYVCLTLGLGGLVSLLMRCWPGSMRQSFGEKCAGVRLVREVRRQLEFG